MLLRVIVGAWERITLNRGGPTPWDKGGGGGGGAGLDKIFFRLFGPQFGLKIKGRACPSPPPVPYLDPPLLKARFIYFILKLFVDRCRVLTDCAVHSLKARGTNASVVVQFTQTCSIVCTRIRITCISTWWRKKQDFMPLKHKYPNAPLSMHDRFFCSWKIIVFRYLSALLVIIDWPASVNKP